MRGGKIDQKHGVVIQLEPMSDNRAQCKYCDMFIQYEKVTTPMPNHVLRCPKNSNKEEKRGQKGRCIFND